MIDAFITRAFADVPDNAPGAHLADQIRTLPPELPDEPTREQVSAWLEPAALPQDPSFADRVREMALAGAMATPDNSDAMQVDMGRLQQLGMQALAEQVLPDSPGGQALVRELLDDGRSSPPDRRSVLADRLETFTNAASSATGCSWENSTAGQHGSRRCQR